MPLLLLCSCIFFVTTSSSLTFQSFFQHTLLTPSSHRPPKDDTSYFSLLSFRFVQSGKYTQWCEPGGSACIEDYSDVPTRATELLFQGTEVYIQHHDIYVQLCISVDYILHYMMMI